ncbi:hypothetical protein BRADI_4g14615v3 [Brachypodium distachyon]|uniref:Uncharacterized protein n=1 Tax=Brachypodium distachyon TaxID=15368 RepID=A0A2K2CMV7_BRADI|nr:hypothetical protein BRADI_4g14615v3 [Brachypodium distachyon]
MAVIRRFLLCLAVAALLARPSQARVAVHDLGLFNSGLSGGVLGGERRPAEAAFRHGLEVQLRAELQGQDGGGRWTRAPPRGEEAAELRMVPGGPDPLHHHGSPRRPELEQPRLP